MCGCVCKWEAPLRVLWLSNTIHSHADNLHSNPSSKNNLKKKRVEVLYTEKKN